MCGWFFTYLRRKGKWQNKITVIRKATGRMNRLPRWKAKQPARKAKAPARAALQWAAPPGSRLVDRPRQTFATMIMIQSRVRIRRKLKGAAAPVSKVERKPAPMPAEAAA